MQDESNDFIFPLPSNNKWVTQEQKEKSRGSSKLIEKEWKRSTEIRIPLSKWHMTVFHKFIFFIFKTWVKFQIMLFRWSNAYSIREPSSNWCCITAHNTKDERLSEDSIPCDESNNWHSCCFNLLYQVVSAVWSWHSCRLFFKSYTSQKV